MNDHHDVPFNDEVAELRQEFDQAFARPVVSPARDIVSVVLLRVANQPYAALLTHILAVDRVDIIAPLPVPDPTLLGVAMVHAELVPVFCLARVLELSGQAGHTILLRLAHPQPLAVAIDTFTGHRVVSGSQVVYFPRGENHGLLLGHVDLPDQRLPLLNLALLAARLDRSASPTTH